MRGEAFEIRIIPARAGFTKRVEEKANRAEDHPRSRGVYIFVTFGYAVDLGSSPLARGLLGLPFPISLSSRIIPARAGFTRSPPGRPT